MITIIEKKKSPLDVKLENIQNNIAFLAKFNKDDKERILFFKRCQTVIGINDVFVCAREGRMFYDFQEVDLKIEVIKK